MKGLGVGVVEVGETGLARIWFEVERVLEYTQFPYVPDKKGLFSHFHPKLVLFLLVKDTLIALNPRIQQLQRELEDPESKLNYLMENESTTESVIADMFLPWRYWHEYNIFNGLSIRIRWLMFRDMSILQSTRLFEEIVLRYVSFSTGRKLVKDMAASATRKSMRYKSNHFMLGQKVFAATMKSQCLFYVAVFCVNTSLEISELSERRGKGAAYGLGQEELGEVIGRNAVRTAKSLTLAAAGAVIGTTIYPGIGTLIGINLLPMLL